MIKLPWMSCPDGKIRAELGCYGKFDVEGNAPQPHVKTAHYTIVQADTGKVFSNRGAAGSINLTLPAVKAGLWFKVLKPTAQSIVFVRGAGVKINGADANLTVAAGTIGIIEVTCDGTEWFLRTVPESVDLDAVEQGTNGQLIIGQTGAAPAYKDVTGDVTINEDGVTAIGAGKVLSAMMSEKLIQYAEVAVSNAEIKGLRAATKELVAAPAAGKALEFVGAWLLLDYGSNVLTRPNGDEDFIVRYQNAVPATGPACSEASVATFPVAGEDAMTHLAPNASALFTAALCAGKALVLHNDGTAEFGGNAGADTLLRVKVAYRVHTTGF